MAIVLALPKLYDDVSERFEEEAPGAVAFFWGQRESQKHKLAAKRIVFIPSDEGDLGEIRAPRGPGANPYSSGPDFTIPDIGRPLANLAELFTVRIETYDISNGENERVQYQAVRELYDAWYRAVYLAAHGNFAIVSSELDDEYNNRRHGMAIVVVCTILAVIPDNAELALTPPPADADISTGYSDDQIEHTITDETPDDLLLVAAPVIFVEDGETLVEGTQLSWEFAAFVNEVTQSNYLMRNGVPQVIEEGETYTVTAEDVTDEASFFIRSIATGEGGPITSDSSTVVAGEAPPDPFDPINFDVSILSDLYVDQSVAGATGVVTGWIDRTGNYVLTQDTDTTARPVYTAIDPIWNNAPSITFDGINDRILDSVIPAVTLPITVYSVVKLTDVGATIRFVYTFGAGAPIAFAWIGSTGQWRIQAGGLTLGIAVPNPGNKKAFCCVFSATVGESAIYAAEQLTGDFTTPLANGTLASDSETSIFVGGLDNAGSFPFKGNVRRIVVSSGAHSALLRAQYLAALRSRGDL